MMHVRHPLSLLLLTLVSLCLGPMAAAYAADDAVHDAGSAAAYQRAATLRERTRNLVLNERLVLHWLDDHVAVYRVDHEAGQRRFMTVDARTGTPTDAFDHERVARQLRERLGAEVDTIHASALPLRLAPAEGRLFATVRGRAAIEIDRATSEVRWLDALDDRDDPRLLPQVRARRSRDGDGETEVLFVNASSGPVKLFWIDRDGQDQSYGMIPAGEQRGQHTFAGHAWRVVAADDRVLGVFRARSTPAVARVDDESSPLPPRNREAPAPGASSDQPEVYVHEHNLWWREGETTTALTVDGTAADYYTKRITWSPDRTKLVVMRTTPAQAHPVHLIDSAPDDRVQPRLITHEYLKPGDDIAHPRPYLIDLTSRAVHRIDDRFFPTPWSINRIAWLPDGSGFTFLYNERGHRVMRLLHVDVETRAVRAVIDEQPATFFDYANKLHLTLRPDAGDAIWMSERSGWNHLYRIDLATGRVLNTVTQGEWVVRAVDSVDRAAGTIHFRAMGVHPDADPYHIHHGRVNIDGTDLTWLTDGDGMHSITASPTGGYHLDTWSRVDQAPVHELRNTTNGALIAELVRAEWTPLRETGWRPPERFVAPGRDGATAIHGLIFTPTNFDPTRSYPVIENIYAGPHGQFVPKTFNTWHGARAIAELGFIVVRIDGMGTNWRSKAFHDVAWKNLGDSGFPDRIAWMRAAAATRPWMDLDRVGIYGGSAGGQSALRAMLAHGDFYDAAVADCGCHDNRMDKIWWNELWMGWPIGDHYAEQSNVTQAHRLSGALMLIVGELDRNVDPASTMQVVDALIKADKDFDLVFMTGAGHGAAETPYGRRRRQDFFVRHLLGAEPRWTTGADEVD